MSFIFHGVCIPTLRETLRMNTFSIEGARILSIPVETLSHKKEKNEWTLQILVPISLITDFEKRLSTSVAIEIRSGELTSNSKWIFLKTSYHPDKCRILGKKE